MSKQQITSQAQITLASASPRRRELLEQVQLAYQVIPVDIDETHLEGEGAEQFVKRLAVEKAKAGYKLNSDHPVLGSDTIVVIDGEILGKPENKMHFLEMFKLLSGQKHRVMTAVAIYDGKQAQCAISKSEVEFELLSQQQVEAYWNTGEPEGKAGGYAVQGIAAQFIRNISGSYSGIMGLPLYETTKLLEQQGIKLLA